MKLQWVKFLFERERKLFPRKNIVSLINLIDRSFTYFFFCLKILPTRHEKASISCSSPLFRNRTRKGKQTDTFMINNRVRFEILAREDTFKVCIMATALIFTTFARTMTEISIRKPSRGSDSRNAIAQREL